MAKREKRCRPGYTFNLPDNIYTVLCTAGYSGIRFCFCG